MTKSLLYKTFDWQSLGRLVNYRAGVKKRKKGQRLNDDVQWFNVHLDAAANIVNNDCDGLWESALFWSVFVSPEGVHDLHVSYNSKPA